MYTKYLSLKSYNYDEMKKDMPNFSPKIGSDLEMKFKNIACAALNNEVSIDVELTSILQFKKCFGIDLFCIFNLYTSR